MKQLFDYFTRLLSYGPLVLLGGLALSGCIEKEDIDRFVNRTFDKGLNVSVQEPIDRDFDKIKKRGVLRMITRYSSNSYFLHKGHEWGFEYELVREFAKKHDLALEVKVIGPDENPYDMLNRGDGDIIAANYTITPERQQYVTFTRPYNVVNQVVVYSSEIEDPPDSIESLAERDIRLTVRRNSSYYHRIRELQDQGYDLNMHLVSDEKDT